MSSPPLLKPRSELQPAAPPDAGPVVGALGQALARSGIVRACLARVERASLPDGFCRRAAAAAIASLEPISRSSCASRSSRRRARALAAAGAMAALTNCRAIDAYVADGPGDAAAVAADARRNGTPRPNGTSFGVRGFDGGGGVSGGFETDENANPNASGDPNDGSMADGGASSFGLTHHAHSFGGDPYSPIAPLPLPRARHHAVLVPALRLAGTLVNALADDGEVHASGVAFLEAHRLVISRILSDRVRHAHLSDLAELEAAVTLVARLATARRQTSGDAKTYAVVDEFVPALDALTARLIAGDGKYDAFIAAASPEGSPSASTSHAEIARRLANERARRKFQIGGGLGSIDPIGSGRLSADAATNGATGGLPPVPAAAAAARIERSHRAVRAALVSTQLALAEQGRCDRFPALEPKNDNLGVDASPRPRPTLASFASLVARLSEELVAEVRQRARILRRLAADGGAGAARAVAADAFGGFVGGAELAGGGGCGRKTGRVSALGRRRAARRRRRWRRGSARCACCRTRARARSSSGPALGADGRGGQRPGGFGTSDSPNLGGGFNRGGGVGSAFRDHDDRYDRYSAGTRTVVGGGAYAPGEIAELSAILAPAIAALADLDLSPTSDLHVGFGDAGGFGDGGRLKGLIRRTRDTLLAAVPANAGEPPTLLLARGERHGGSHDGVSPARGFAQSPLPPPRFGLFNA